MPYDRKATAKLAMEAYADALEKATKGVFFGDLDERDVAMEAMEAAVAAVEPAIRAGAQPEAPLVPITGYHMTLEEQAVLDHALRMSARPLPDPMKERAEAAEARVRELEAALEGVVRVADRRTVEFDRARAALHLPEASTPT